MKRIKVTKAQRLADYEAEQLEQMIKKVYTRRWKDMSLEQDEQYLYFGDE
jgi:hypothetical protein